MTRGSGRVVVIGAGHNGLVAAIRLADAGLEVVVLEQGQRPGGAVKSAEDTLPGFVHDRCAGFLPLTVASTAFAGLGVRERVDWVDPPVAMAHPFLDGTAIALHRDVGATCDSLEDSAPGAGGAWRALVAPLLRRRATVMRAALSPFPPLLPGAALAVQLRRDGVELARRMLASAATFGGEAFGHDRPTAWLCGSATHADLTPGAAGGGAFAFFLTLLGHAVGWPYPRGGAGRLTEALVDRLHEAGGRVRCDARVVAITVRGARAAGVRLDGGEELAADAVVAAVSAAPLASMLPADALPQRLLVRLRRWRYGLGTFNVDYALSGPVPWVSPVARQAGVVHLGDTLDAVPCAATGRSRPRPGRPDDGRWSAHVARSIPGTRRRPHAVRLYARATAARPARRRHHRAPRGAHRRLRPRLPRSDPGSMRPLAGRHRAGEPQPRRGATSPAAASSSTSSCASVRRPSCSVDARRCVASTSPAHRCTRAAECTASAATPPRGPCSPTPHRCASGAEPAAPSRGTGPACGAPRRGTSAA